MAKFRKTCISEDGVILSSEANKRLLLFLSNALQFLNIRQSKDVGTNVENNSDKSKNMQLCE